MNRFHLLTAGLVMLLALGRTPRTAALDDPQAVDAARQALERSTSRLPWYDAQSDGLARIPVRPAPAPRPPGDWQWEPINPSGPAVGNWSSIFWELVQYLVWALLALLLAFGLFLLVRTWLRKPLGLAGSDLNRRTAGDGGDADRVENLPFPLLPSRTDLLAEARRHYAAGHFAEAVIYLFSYQLVELDKAQWIRLARGKTNRQYLRELHAHGDIRRLLAQTMQAFEDVFFGRHALDRHRFESCWSRLGEFQQLVEQPAADG